MRKYDNYCSALETLQRAPQQDLSNEFVQGGIIGKFSLQFEQGWKLLKALLAYEGDAAGQTESPRDIIKAAWGMFDFLDEELWLSMLRDRNDTAHIYNAQLAQELIGRIIIAYLPAFIQLRDGVAARYGKDALDGMR